MKKKNLFTVLLMFIVCMAMLLVGCNNDPTGGDNDNNGNDDTHTYYTVTFDSNGGSAIESQRILEGNTARRPNVPVYGGYDFTGWYKDDAATNDLWNFDTDRVNSDLTLYAGWELTSDGSEKPDIPDDGQKNVLVAYFSATGNTEPLARFAAEVTGGTLYEIVPKIPYTAADLDYTDNSSRANREQSNPDSRPEISGRLDNIERYDIVFIGYPIWHGQAPKIIYTFLESYDFDGKTIVPFCTSASSGLGSSASNLHAFASDADWKDGRRFAIGTNKSTIASWVDGLNLNIQKEQEMKISIKSGNLEIIYLLNDSKAAKELYEQLPLIVAVEPFSNNEIIFYPEKLDTSDAPFAKGGAGSLAYYAPWGDVVLFYGSFNESSSLFELGKIVSGVENIKNLSGTVTITAC